MTADNQIPTGRVQHWLLGVTLMAFGGPAAAHGFGTLYTLPVPVALYLWSAAAALLLSFIVVGLLVNPRNLALNDRQIDLSRYAFFRGLLHPATLASLRGLSLFAFLLTIAAGLFGTNNPWTNFSMTLFWIVFVLGFAYFIAIFGNWFAVISPWVIICDGIQRLWPNAFAGRVRWPARLGWWPALAFYMGFIWFELFGQSRPFSLAIALLGYSAVTLLGAFVFGRAAWFRHAEFFGVMFDILGRMSPFAVQNVQGERHIILRQPFVGLTREPVAQTSLLLFVLFMLSSTAFDGIKSTVPYLQIYWTHVANWLDPFTAIGKARNFAALKAIYVWWQTAVMILSPFIYLGVYLFFMALTKWAARSDVPLRELALRFAYTLVPIAFVYHLTHYYTLLLSQGTQIVALASDPFDLDWNLFGTANLKWFIIPKAGTIWHTQLWLILVGHIFSVYLAHSEALKVFGDRGRAVVSQLPMLLLMVVLTTLGLWILSLPISRGAG